MKTLLTTILFSLLFFHSSFALKFMSGDEKVISQPVYEDLYIAGGTLTVNAPVYGDLVIAGGTIILNDSVAEDLVVAGGNITINSPVGDDIRCAGGDIKIKSTVNGDLVIAGGKILLEREAVINGDVMAGAGTLLVNGTIRGNLKAGVGELHMDGFVGKDMDCRGEDIRINGTVSGKSVIAAQELLVGSTASFNNGVRYWTRERKTNFGQSVKNGQAVYDDSLMIQRDHWYFLGFSVVLAALWYIAVVFLFILLIQYLFSGTMRAAADKAYNHTMQSFGYGVLYIIVTPVALAILFITIIGIPIALLLLIAYILLAILATVISSVVIANWFNQRNQKGWSNGTLVLVAILAFIVLKLLSFIPFVGWLLMFVIASITFGSIIRSVNWRNKREAMR